jgi:hypothetical protein
MRLYSVIGIGPTRIVKKRMQLGPYVLPKGTVVWAMLTAMHKSPRVWDDPESFIPVNPQTLFPLCHLSHAFWVAGINTLVSPQGRVAQ